MISSMKRSCLVSEGSSPDPHFPAGQSSVKEEFFSTSFLSIWIWKSLCWTWELRLEAHQTIAAACSPRVTNTLAFCDRLGIGALWGGVSGRGTGGCKKIV